jgi:GNAT superfamily N-acetyltransferase
MKKADAAGRKLIEVRAAQEADIAPLFALMTECAESNASAVLVEGNEADLRTALLSPHPDIHCEILLHDGARVGFLFWSYVYCPFRGRRGVIVGDFFVKAEIRNKGVGHAALAHLARRCVAEGLGSLDWLALAWDEATLAFYRAQGAKISEDWLRCRMGPEQFWRLAHDDEAAT